MHGDAPSRGSQLKKWISLLAVVSSLLLYQNCSGTHESWLDDGQSGSSSYLTNSISLASFEANLHPVLTTNCSECHGVSQQPLHSLPEASFALDVIASFNLVNLETPEESTLVNKIRNGHRSIAQTVADEMQQAIQRWADDIVASGGSLTPDTSSLQPTFSSIHNLILQPKCVSCHSPDGSRPQEDYTDYFTTINTGKIEPGDAATSTMFTQCQTGAMPQGGPSLTPEELGVLQEWINDGALNN